MPRCPSRHTLRALAMVADHNGAAQPATFVKHNGRYTIGGSTSRDEPVLDEVAPVVDDDWVERNRRLRLLATSGRFSATEVRTLYLLAVERFSVAQIAVAERCTRQAVVARLVGNSKHQGGLMKKAARFWTERGGTASPTCAQP